MLCSMTGYGKGEIAGEGGRYLVEIKSVNNRYCDISVRTPRELSLIDEFVKSSIKDRISRGKIDVMIRYETDTAGGPEPLEIKVSIGAMEQYLEAFKNAAGELDLKNDITLKSLIELPEVLRIEKKQTDIESIFIELKPALLQAVDSLISFRSKEGSKLAYDMKKKADEIADMLKMVAHKAPLMSVEYGKLLGERLKEYYLLEKTDDQRIAQEVALMADKCCIDEEIVRLRGHLDHFTKELDTGGRIGRKLDFITQEINREVNTIGSKSSDYEISKTVIEMKSIVEQIREQVQNIE